MKQLTLLLFLLSSVFVCSMRPQPETTKKPYEATWMKITETDSGYVVYNYPHLEFDSVQSPEIISIKGDVLSFITFSDAQFDYNISSIAQKRDNQKYYFPIGNHFLFEWYDKEKHIVRWTTYYGDEKRVMTDYLYVDSVYNTFPIVDYDWGNEPAPNE